MQLDAAARIPGRQRRPRARPAAAFSASAGVGDETVQVAAWRARRTMPIAISAEPMNATAGQPDSSDAGDPEPRAVGDVGGQGGGHRQAEHEPGQPRRAEPGAGRAEHRQADAAATVPSMRQRQQVRGQRGLPVRDGQVLDVDDRRPPRRSRRPAARPAVWPRALRGPQSSPAFSPGRWVRQCRSRWNRATSWSAPWIRAPCRRPPATLLPRQGWGLPTPPPRRAQAWRAPVDFGEGLSVLIAGKVEVCGVRN